MAEDFAPVSIFALTRSTSKSGRSAHSRQPIIGRIFFVFFFRAFASIVVTTLQNSAGAPCGDVFSAGADGFQNFVVKNGLEVNTDLILADVDTNRVGIGTSIADYTLHVNGGIGATDLNITGVATVTSLTVSNDVSVTSLDTTNVNVTGVGTIKNAVLTNITGTAATISSVQIASGIVTATSGLVTYYGDGQYLRNIQNL